MELDFDVESLRIDDDDDFEPPNRLDGEFATEKEACSALDVYLGACKAFEVYKEVKGYFVQPRPWTGDSEPRIDRLMVPTIEAMQRGWNGGIIGIEAKRSGGTIGPAITQGMDYTKCCFRLSGEVLVMPTWVFVFPMRNPYKAAESIMTNNRIGQCYEEIDYKAPLDSDKGLFLQRFKKKLRFTVGSFITLEISADGLVPMLKTPTCGNKRGCRSPRK